MELKIFSLNCWLLPAFISPRNRMRLKKIIGLIEHHAPDVIALQEVWLYSHLRILEKSLPGYDFISSRSGPFIRSGLVTGISKKKSAKSKKMIFFPKSKGNNLLERIAKKGFHSVNLGDVVIINTHLYASKDISPKINANQQLDIIQRYFRSKDCIIAGDLNMREHEIKDHVHFDIGPSKDYTATSNRPYLEFFSGKPISAAKKIDYIMKKKGSRISLNVKCIRRPMLSDHCALIGYVKK